VLTPSQVTRLLAPGSSSIRGMSSTPAESLRARGARKEKRRGVTGQ